MWIVVPFDDVVLVCGSGLVEGGLGFEGGNLRGGGKLWLDFSKIVI